MDGLCWLVVTGTMEFHDFPFTWEFHHPPLTFTPSFFRGVGWNHQPGLVNMALSDGSQMIPSRCSRWKFSSLRGWRFWGSVHPLFSVRNTTHHSIIYYPHDFRLMPILGWFSTCCLNVLFFTYLDLYDRYIPFSWIGTSELRHLDIPMCFWTQKYFWYI